jgi:hypothetical protein
METNCPPQMTVKGSIPARRIRSIMTILWCWHS